MNKTNIKVSVISPVYQASQIVPELVKQLRDSLKTITSNYEIILVDDGSTDSSWNAILTECTNNHHIKGIKLSRNFGQHYAISAGTQNSNGDVIILMDCDLQDNPDNLESIVDLISKGYDIVFTKRKKREHSLYKKFTAAIFNWLFKFISDKNYDINMGSLVGFNAKVLKEFNSLGERDRLYIQMLKWLGFNSTHITVEHRRRHSGSSSYTFRNLLQMAIQGWTSHSDKLLKFSIYIGLILGGASFMGVLVVLILYFSIGLQAGWPSVIVTILFSTGLILVSLGITGLYIGKVFQQVKERPLFIIDTTANITPNE